MSKTAVMAPIVSALVKAEDIIGKVERWNADNYSQATFLGNYFVKRGELAPFSTKELRNWASFIAAELNSVLKKEGFEIQLEEFAENEFGVVSILDLLVEWLAKGSSYPIKRRGKQYPGVQLNAKAMDESGNYLHLFEGCVAEEIHPHPVARVFTKSGDVVCMTVATESLDGFELLSKVGTIRANLKVYSNAPFLAFPKVDLIQKVDIGWLKKLWTQMPDGRMFEISQALQQTKFKMNERGAHVKSAVAIGVRTLTAVMHEPSPIIIDKPFYLWIEREDLSYPVMAAYITEEDWKDPGDIEKI